MSVEKCINNLADEGVISKKAATEALELWRTMANGAGDRIDGASAEAYSAIETAKIMAENAQAKRVQIAKNAAALSNAQTRIDAHSRGKTAGLMSLLVRDIWDDAKAASATTRGRTNIEGQAEAVLGQLMGRFATGAEALQSRLAGLAQDTEGAWSAVGELFGVNSGKDISRQAAKGFSEAIDYGVNRAKAAGKMFNVIDDWRVPQFWDPTRLNKIGLDQFRRDVADAMNSGGLKLLDKKTGGYADMTRAGEIVDGAFKDIRTGSNPAMGGGGFRSEMRVFKFQEGEAGFRAYRSLMEKYGTGHTIYDVMTGHLSAMAREISMVETLGPNYAANFRSLHRQVQEAEKGGLKAPKVIRLLGQESAAAAQRTMDYLTGRLSVPQSEMMAGIFGGLRAWLTASKLGGAFIPAIFGDTSTMMIASNYNGVSGMKVLARALDEMVADGKGARQAAARLGLVAHAVSDTALGVSRFQDETALSSIRDVVRGRGGDSAAQTFQKTASGLANVVIRAQGLQAWTESMKRAFSMEFFAMMAETSGRSFDKLDQPFRRFLDRYGFTADDWNTLRQTPQLEARGAKFFDTAGVQDEALRDRLINAVLDERQFAIMEASARTAQVTSGGLQRGTFWGEMARSMFMFKSFTITMLTTHGIRAASQAGWQNKLQYAASLMAFTTLAGSATILAKDVLAGKDPQPVNTPNFLMQSLVTGGGTGIFGDLINQGFTRADTTLSGAVAGPIAAGVDQTARLIFPAVRDAVAGEDTKFGAELAKAVKSNLPGSNIWYLRLALGRLVFDQFQMQVDPEYRRSFQRMEARAKKETNQGFWWRPGDVAPRRAPNMSNLLQ